MEYQEYKAASFWFLFFVIFAAVPLVKTSDYQLMLATHILLWGMFAVFQPVVGLTGMLSFGQGLYYGLGVYPVGLWCVTWVTDGGAWYKSLALWAHRNLNLLGLLIIRVSGVFFTVLTLASVSWSGNSCLDSTTSQGVTTGSRGSFLPEYCRTVSCTITSL